MIRVRIETNDTATPVLRAFARRAEDRAKLLDVVATAEKLLFSEHIAAEARVRHTSAQRLGATPTGQLEKVAGGVTAAPTADGVTVRVDEPYLFARAFRDVDIVPKAGKKFLTIPIAARSYGRRIKDFAPGDRKGLFAFVPRVRQTQDRKLLPSDEGILQAAEEAAKDYLLKKRETGGVA